MCYKHENSWAGCVWPTEDGERERDGIAAGIMRIRTHCQLNENAKHSFWKIVEKLHQTNQFPYEKYESLFFGALYFRHFFVCVFSYDFGMVCVWLVFKQFSIFVHVWLLPSVGQIHFASIRRQRLQSSNEKMRPNSVCTIKCKLLLIEWLPKSDFICFFGCLKRHFASF